MTLPSKGYQTADVILNMTSRLTWNSSGDITLEELTTSVNDYLIALTDFSSTDSLSPFQPFPLTYSPSSLSLSSPSSSSPSSPYIRGGSEETCDMFSFVLNTVFIGALCILGLCGNTLSIAVLRRDKHNEIATFLLQVLAVGDNLLLLVSFLVLVLFVGLAGQFQSVYVLVRPALPYMKKYLNPVGYITKSFTIWTTVLLAINRFIAVCKPFLAERALTKQRAYLQILVVSLTCVCVNIPRFFQYDIVPRFNPYNNETVQVNILTPLGSNKLFEMVYFNIIYTSLFLFLPLLLLVIFNLLLVIRLRKSSASLRRNSINYVVSSQERNITLVMIIIIVEVLICHTPDRIVTVLKYLTARSDWLCPNPLYYTIHSANVLVIINSSLNFFIYYIFRERFRRLLLAHVLPPLCLCRGERGGMRAGGSGDSDLGSDSRVNSGGELLRRSARHSNGAGSGGRVTAGVGGVTGERGVQYHLSTIQAHAQYL